MPYKAATPCRVPNCRGLAVSRGRCAEHATERQRADYADRAEHTAAHYGARWRKVRDAHISAHPLCVQCQAAGRVVAATEVDHIIPVRAGGTDRADNLQSLCHSCHMTKTARERAGGMGGRNLWHLANSIACK